jgi:uncharacterized protein (DUF983 family)
MKERAGATRPELSTTLVRGLRLRCPVCGGASVFRAPFQVRRECPACRALFQREAGFFVGAIMMNVVATEGAVMLAFGLCMLVPGATALMLPVLFAVALLFPLLFYHHSWSLWLAGDHFVERLPVRGPGS